MFLVTRVPTLSNAFISNIDNPRPCSNDNSYHLNKLFDIYIFIFVYIIFCGVISYMTNIFENISKHHSSCIC